jgi:hypothetical protein
MLAPIVGSMQVDSCSSSHTTRSAVPSLHVFTASDVTAAVVVASPSAFKI